MSHEKREEINRKQEEEFDKTLPVSTQGTDSQLYNGGNPVFSCNKRVLNADDEGINLQDNFKGYNSTKSHPMYMTSAMEYGSNPPTVHTMPTSFHGKSQKFSNHLGQCGMYRNHSLNTGLDTSNVSNNNDGLF